MSHLSAIDKALQAALDDPSSSEFLKFVIRAAMDRDFVDVANELEWLSALFSQRVDAVLEDAQCNGMK